MIEKLTQTLATLILLVIISDFFIGSWQMPINGIYALAALLVGFNGFEQFQKQRKRSAFACFAFSIFLLFTIGFESIAF